MFNRINPNEVQLSFQKAMPGEHGETARYDRRLYEKLMAAAWAEKWAPVANVAKASNPGVPAVAGPNLVNGQLAMSFVSYAGFVAQSVFPSVGHPQPSGQYPVWDVNKLKGASLQPAGDGTAPDELDDGISFQKFAVDVFSGRRSLGDLTLAAQAAAVNNMQQAGRFLTQAGLQTIETEFTEACWKTGVWGTDLNVPAGQKFDNSASSPDKTLQEAIELLTNYWPNMEDYIFVCSLPVWNALMRHERFRGQGAVELAQGTPTRFTEITGITRVAVGRAGKSTTAGYLGKHAAIFVAPMTKGMNDPSAASRVFWTGVANADADMGIATRMQRDSLNYRTVVDAFLTNTFVIQTPGLGYFFNGAIS